MDRRRLLAVIAATAFATAALTGAVAATTHLFTAGEAAAGVGTISPVSTPTAPPIVEHKVLDVEDPAPVPAPAAPPAAAPAPRTSSPTVHEDRVVTAPATPATTAAPVAPAPPPSAPTRPDGFEPGDD